MSRCVYSQDLHSFPTRRSSDLPSRSGKKSSSRGTKKQSSDDEDDEDEDDESEEEDDEEPTSKIKVGSKVEFTDDKGKDLTGTVVAVTPDENICTIKDSKGKRHIGVDLDEVEVQDVDEEDEDEDDEPPKKSASKAGKKTVAKDDDEDEEDEDEEGEAEVGDWVSFVRKGKKVKGRL